MTLQPEVLRAVTIVIVVLIICLSLVAIIAPAALTALVRPLTDTINRLVALLGGNKSEPPDDQKKP